MSPPPDGLSPPEEKDMTDETQGGLDRRETLKCMLWAGTAVVWTVSGGVPASRLIGSAKAADAGFSFVQLSDSHIGFSKPANPDAGATLNVAIDKVLAMPGSPAFMIHTGDVSHTAEPKQFDDALELIKRARLDAHYAPGEHDILDPKTEAAYYERFGKGAGGGWYSFDHGGVHFVSLNNVVNLKTNGLGSLGSDQLAWLDDDLRGKSASTPIVLFCHIPLWMVAPEWGWGTEDSAQALKLVSRFGSVTVLNGHIHQLMQKVEGNVTFHTARSTAFPQPAPGSAPSPGPKKVPAGELSKWLGVREVAYTQSPAELAVTDSDLA
jgi:3',5'-cyclic AMP phosphodiesterase CpdA